MANAIIQSSQLGIGTNDQDRNVSGKFVQTPPAPKPLMKLNVGTSPSELASGNSPSSSITAIDRTQEQRRSRQEISSDDNEKIQDDSGKTKYEQWYPGDATHDGRPAWWNRYFCCGYGLGCLLCPCGSWNCKHERS
ncbi:uncharacterized protein IL334_002738 [Kwoniella shivajii]|uniref:Cysteine-rich transmembrane CYSTM domain-containing protein n=1 Tax=Kwoniella shivajii TaxID=564305 RepID=A0ABZ1CWV6_9TREE|nr:hypothetical protein IL334_002738 [Kwoniella shivajii]